MSFCRRVITAVMVPFALACSSEGGSPEATGTAGGSAGVVSAGGSAGSSGASGSSDGGVSAVGGENGAGTSGAASAGGNANAGAAGVNGGTGAGTGGHSGSSGHAGASGEFGAGGAAVAAGSGGVAGAAGSGGAGDAGSGGKAGSVGNAGNAGSDVACDADSVVSRCTGAGTAEIACHLGGEPGNYEVTVKLGGETAGSAYVEAEMYRRMLGPSNTDPGQTVGASFVVNVRHPEGQPIQNGANEGRTGLDVYIRGSAPQLAAICYKPAQPPITIWIGGDSTVCDQSGTDYSGWGQHLPQFFGAPVAVANYADSGESSGSFLGSGSLFGAIRSRWRAGDWFFLQVGHNDKNTAADTFDANLRSFATQAKAAGVNIVLVTPIARVGGALADQHVNSTGANLPQIIRDLGQSEDVPVIDLTVTTWNWLQTITWQDHFALGTDRTHPNPKGAEAIAGFVRDAIVAQDLAIASYLR